MHVTSQRCHSRAKKQKHGEIQSRATISEISDGGFKIVQEMSMDGQNWMPMSEEVYAPRGN